MTVFRRLLRYLAPYRSKTAAALGAMVVVAVSTGALVFFFRSLFDDVLAPAGGARPSAALPLAKGSHGALMRALDAAYGALKAGLVARGIPLWAAVPALLLAALVVKNVFSYLSEYEFNGIGLSMVRDLRADAYDHLV
ncbi:MAG TPA: hypothetical protein VG777_03750, partial [Thermoanaerobaculia bacterium]|nr:hypothetical protein [Thermoanaerobaculia bacterium]